MNNPALAAVTALTLLASGCSAATDKSGGSIKPTTLVMASNDGANPSSRAAERFVELVDEKSHGQLEIEVSPAWAAKGEQRVLEDVAAGKAELGWSGTRAFDLIGADGFQPLHAPFLIGSYEAERAVLGDDVAHDMLDTLSNTGLTGLALLGDELRFPAAHKGPLLEADDFDDVIFGVMSSKIQAAAVSDLGARVRQFPAPGSPASLGLEALETMWWTLAANNQQLLLPFITANAVLWPRTSVIVANTEAFDALDGEDRDVLTEAATEAAQWSLEHADDSVDDEIAQACRSGARVATATPAQLATLTQAVQPTYAALRTDPEQGALLARVERLVSGAGPAAPVDVPDRCAYRPGEGRRPDPDLPAPLDHPGSSGQLPEGSYRYAFTEDELDRALHLTPEYNAGNAGVWTWTLRDGRWRFDLQQTARDVPDAYKGTYCEGYYDVQGHEVDFTAVDTGDSPGCLVGPWKADWRRTKDGLRMDVTADGDDLEFLFGSKLWERID